MVVVAGAFVLFVFPARGSAYNSDWIVWRRPLAARVWEHLACRYSPSVVVRFAFGILVHESPVGAFTAATDLLAVGITQTPALLSTFVHHRCCRCSFVVVVVSSLQRPYHTTHGFRGVLYCRIAVFFFSFSRIFCCLCGLRWVVCFFVAGGDKIVRRDAPYGFAATGWVQYGSEFPLRPRCQLGAVSAGVCTGAALAAAIIAVGSPYA